MQDSPNPEIPVLTERGVLMGVATEEANTRPGSGRSALLLAAAPTPGHPSISKAIATRRGYSCLSLNSFPPEKATGIEMALFLWAEKRSGLTDF
jgi:hypothetical protein